MITKKLLQTKEVEFPFYVLYNLYHTYLFNMYYVSARELGIKYTSFF